MLIITFTFRGGTGGKIYWGRYWLVVWRLPP